MAQPACAVGEGCRSGPQEAAPFPFPTRSGRTIHRVGSDAFHACHGGKLKAIALVSSFLPLPKPPRRGVAGGADCRDGISRAWHPLQDGDQEANAFSRPQVAIPDPLSEKTRPDRRKEYGGIRSGSAGPSCSSRTVSLRVPERLRSPAGRRRGASGETTRATGHHARRTRGVHLRCLDRAPAVSERPCQPGGISPRGG